MRILIIENEIYLAQSISSKLSELGYHCDTISLLKEEHKQHEYDVVLLSTSISGQDIYPIIERYKKSVVILMVSYISNDTVSKPLGAGAKDYIQKPFMIEDLIRKIEHFQHYEKLKFLSDSYNDYINHSLESVNVEREYLEKELPLFITCNNQKQCDAFAFAYAKKEEKTLYFVSLTDENAFEKISAYPDSAIIYISDFQLLKKSDYDDFMKRIEGKNVIVTSSDTIGDIDAQVVQFSGHNELFDQGEILPIEDYVKYIVLNYQHIFPDTELSKKLGISRKSLWEKRKKYGIVKKK